MSIKEAEEKNDIDSLEIYKKTVLWSKLRESMEEMKSQNKLSKNLEEKINSKFNSFISDKLNNKNNNDNKSSKRNMNTLNAKVTSSSSYNDSLYTFCCKDAVIKLEKESIPIPELKIIAIDENSKIKNKNFKGIK